MATLETQYRNYVDSNPETILPFDDWKKKLGKSIGDGIKKIQISVPENVDMSRVVKLQDKDQDDEKKKQRVINTMIGLGFDLDNDNWKEGYLLFSHPINKDSEFSIMWVRGMYDLDNLHKVGSTLLKLGQYQKIQQINSYI